MASVRGRRAPLASISRTDAASTSAAAGYQRPARCGSLTRGRGPAGSLIDILRSRSWISFAHAHGYPSLTLMDIRRSRSWLVAETEPEAAHLWLAEAPRAAHHVDGLQHAPVRDGRLVVPAPHGSLFRAAGAQEVVADDIAGPRVPRAVDGGSAAGAAEGRRHARVHPGRTCTDKDAPPSTVPRRL